MKLKNCQKSHLWVCHCALRLGLRFIFWPRFELKIGSHFFDCIYFCHAISHKAISIFKTLPLEVKKKHHKKKKNRPSGAWNSVVKKKSEKKKRFHDSTTRPSILYLVKLFTFLLKFLPFSPSFNLQKLFLMFFTSTIYPKDILRKQFSQKSFSEKKKQKKIIHFFFFFRFFFFFVQNLLNTSFLSILLKFIFFQQKKKIEKPLRLTSTF